MNTKENKKISRSIMISKIVDFKAQNNWKKMTIIKRYLIKSMNLKAILNPRCNNRSQIALPRKYYKSRRIWNSNRFSSKRGRLPCKPSRLSPRDILKPQPNQ